MKPKRCIIWVQIELYQIPEIWENFYAITASRRAPNPYLAKLLNSEES